MTKKTKKMKPLILGEGEHRDSKVYEKQIQVEKEIPRNDDLQDEDLEQIDQELNCKNEVKPVAKKNPVPLKRRTRGQVGKKVRVDNNGVLKMAERLFETKGSKVKATRVQCEDALFGYDSYTFVSWEDFQVVFTLEELTGSIITCYMM